jgi:hypothetical protein
MGLRVWKATTRCWPLDALDRATHVDRMGVLQEVSDARMAEVARGEDLLGLGLPIGSPDLANVKNGEHHTLGITQSERPARLERGGHVGTQVERDRYRPQGSISEPHRGAHRLVVSSSKEAGKRREPAIHQQLEIALLPGGEVPRRPVPRGGAQLSGALLVGEQVDDSPTVGGDEVIGHNRFISW